MKFGINTFLWTAGFDESNLDLLPRIKAAGFDGVEVARVAFDGFPAAKIGRAISDAGLECTVCSALTGELSLVTEDANARARTVDFLKSAIEATAELGATTLAGPFCAPVGYLPGRRRTGDEWGRAIEGLQQLGSVLNEANVNLAVEPLNRFETFFLNTAADGWALCDAVRHPRIGLLFDTFHANIEEKTAAGAIADCGPHIVHVHTCENDRGTPGSGHVPWPEVFQSLRAANYDSWMVIESFGSAIRELAAAACIWRDLAPTTEEIAWDGVKFLKTL
jgi:D-psicose/D-tagatose/L-ribulose 3-epimerase